MATDAGSRSALLMALCLGRASLSDASWALTMPVTKPCSSRKSCIISSEAGVGYAGGSVACPHWPFIKKPLRLLARSPAANRDSKRSPYDIACLLPPQRIVSNARLEFKRLFETKASHE